MMFSSKDLLSTSGSGTAQGVNDFRIMVCHSYDIYVVVSMSFSHFVQTATYLFVWGILVFFGVGDFPLFFKKSKRIAIVVMHSATVLCGLCVLHRNGL